MPKIRPRVAAHASRLPLLLVAIAACCAARPARATADLSVVQVDAATVEWDPEHADCTGQVQATVLNVGDTGSGKSVRALFFEDLDNANCAPGLLDLGR
jgi:hypothetical protein